MSGSDDPRCGMVHAHHPDCECRSCLASIDEECGRPAVAYLGAPSAGLFVCQSDAEMVVADPEAYDPMTPLDGPPSAGLAEAIERALADALSARPKARLSRGEIRNWIRRLPH